MLDSKNGLSLVNPPLNRQAFHSSISLTLNCEVKVIKTESSHRR